ncbi:DUF600 family protein [Streptococcus infantis]|uniref:immunity protein YezG family protein n=1 Tax=Streptococcus infantis TaxID=68892 RepID=UPI001F298E75|nr:immunity protein YezG family protein [Streptococcus infantis]UJD04371.1 DUF600 family protein [Streptococcus infantis]
MEKQIMGKIREIAQSVNETIPVAWDNLFINISLAFDGGEVYYFFNEEGKNEYIYNLYIPKRYGIPNLEFRNQERRTFRLAWELREIFEKEGQPLWTSCTIKVISTKLSAEFDYAPWNESDYSSGQQMDFFEYKYLGKQPANEKELEQFKAMEAFQREHNGK